MPVRTFKIVCHSFSLKVKLEDMYFASMWWYGIIHIYISPNVFVDSANFPYLLSTPFKENRIVFSVKTSFDCVMTMSSYQNARRRTKIELVERLLFIELIF